MDNMLTAQEILHPMGNKREGKNFMAIKIGMKRAYMIKCDRISSGQ